MSNCIELGNNVVEILPYVFDISAFEALREKYKDVSRHPSSDLGAELYIYVWFLRDNSEVNYKENLVIRFGEGNSTHTWRDFRQTLWLLNPFFKKPWVHTFLVSDEYDGFNSVGYLTVRFPYESSEKLYEAV